ncbi:glutaminase A [Methylocucumis oryzae]|uniref:glutaminase A n=1 Tax=Methylocucumis oryzae TaxID=1632867 RepID=UPI0009E43F2C|nr:glutaminase A [Methylocucumis oryzae]
MNAKSFLNYLENLRQEYLTNNPGEVASYIPELLKVDADWLGISVVTVDGHVYQVGDSKQDFTIQSISKVITYGMALEDKGVTAVLEKVDVEPSGEAFNSISLEPGTGRPRNPMINAGAIATVSLLADGNAQDKLKRMLDVYQSYVGHPVRVDEDVYRSEKETGHRNRAIGYMLRNYDIIEKDTDDVLDLYFKQCSILVTCRDLALIGATLANNGVNPITGIRALNKEYVPNVLGVMSSCGMYDYSGAWIYNVGMPAKSGVGGGVVAVLPGQLSIAVFSPKLDDKGNSFRGIEICKRISKDFGLHLFHSSQSTVSTVIHARYSGASIRSKRYRIPEQAKLLNELGNKVMVFELAGDLMFTSMEIALSEAEHNFNLLRYLVLDFRRVTSINTGAIHLLVDFIYLSYEQGIAVILTNASEKFLLTNAIKKQIPNYKELQLLHHNDIDVALEWCEESLLSGHATINQTSVALADMVLCEGFTEAEISSLQHVLDKRNYNAGANICSEGEPADSLYFVVSGEVEVVFAAIA